ncbi:type II secretion system F family protein [Agromyces sp. LHK192]|uniref:type II secretion system F family protein n=1 Tax=Agromyces sp. LHK192 TaxID=2498704 RepID=UPI001F0CB31F|nr:type II secretion system F family protein [Agromyces sp. LHK192]
MVRVNAPTTLAIAVGALLGLGLWLLVAATPRIGRPRLMERVAPSIADISEAARESMFQRRSDPAPVIGLLVLPAVRRLREVLGQVLGGDATIARRLRQARSSTSVDRWRSEQLAAAGVAFAVGSALAVFAPSFHALPTVVRFTVPVLAAALGAMAFDWWLQRKAQRRMARISAELPTVLEFLTLSLTAGEGILEAIRRVARAGSGELAAEFAQVAAAVSTGVPLATALTELRDGLAHPALSRALDQVLGALERGAPLAAVLSAQAGDAREESKRTIIELAGRKEIAMLVPLIFLILPVTVAFALFPGYLVLKAGF